MEPKRGLFAGGGTTVRLPRQIPWAQAMEFLLCADLIPAERAYEMGLLNAIVPREELLDTARAYAASIEVLTRLGKELRTAFEKESRISSAIFQTEDAKEGPRAFAEKRKPVWQAR